MEILPLELQYGLSELGSFWIKSGHPSLEYSKSFLQIESSFCAVIFFFVSTLIPGWQLKWNVLYLELDLLPLRDVDLEGAPISGCEFLTRDVRESDMESQETHSQSLDSWRHFIKILCAQRRHKRLLVSLNVNRFADLIVCQSLACPRRGEQLFLFGT